MKRSVGVKMLSVVIPAHNEADGIEAFHQSLLPQLNKINDNLDYEIIYIDDGSRDTTREIISKIAKNNKNVKLLVLTKNFGKEAALTAGMCHAHGDFVLTMDADGQHPVTLLPSIMKRWGTEENDMLIGIRKDTKSDTLIKRWGSMLFYKFVQLLSSNTALKSNATDFRIVSREVVDAFCVMNEHDRMTRGLIDWLGYKVDYFEFEANDRQHGTATYSTKKLVSLALSGITASSFKPLYLSFYIGLFALIASAASFAFLIVNYIIHDPLGLHVTGSAYVVIFTTFLVGVVLIGQGMIAYYLSKMFIETQGRPLYVVHKRLSKNMD